MKSLHNKELITKNQQHTATCTCVHSCGRLLLSTPSPDNCSNKPEQCSLCCTAPERDGDHVGTMRHLQVTSVPPLS